MIKDKYVLSFENSSTVDKVVVQPGFSGQIQQNLVAIGGPCLLQ